MVEVHLVRLEFPAAIRTWNTTKVANQLDHPCLPDTDPLQLQVAVPPVVLDVVLSLAGSNGHGLFSHIRSNRGGMAGSPLAWAETVRDPPERVPNLNDAMAARRYSRARWRNATICSRSTGRRGQKFVPPQPVVTPASKMRLMSTS